MRVSIIVAGGIALALTAWLASPYLPMVLAKNQPIEEDQGDVADEAPKPILAVRVVTSKAVTIERQIILNGNTEAVRSVELRAETSGRVQALPVKEGSFVNAGTVLASIDRRHREASVAWAEASVAQRQLEYDAARKLSEKGFQAQTRVAEAHAFLQQAEAELETYQVDLEHTEIRAPFDGILDDRPVEVGDFLDIGDPIGTVVDLNPILVTADVPEASIMNVRTGMFGTALTNDGRSLTGTVRYVARRADEATRTFLIELEIDNDDLSIPAGISTEVRLSLGTMEAHRVSPALLGLDDRGVLGVKAVDESGLVLFYPAEIAKNDVEAVWLSGLPSELRLITVGQGFARQGQIVEVSESKAENAS